VDAKITGDKASSVRADLVSALTAIREMEIMVLDGQHPKNDHPNPFACALS
jgi:hypothetical protein